MLASLLQMALFINWFKVDLTPATFMLPTKDYPTWEDSTSARDSDELKPFATYRGRTGPDKISIILLNGPGAPPAWEIRDFAAHTHRNVVSEIIKRTLEVHFQSGRLVTSRSKWGVTATRPVNVQANNAIQLSCGVSCHVHFPDCEAGIGVTIQWQVTTEFVKSLADDQLRGMCENLPVLLRYNLQEWQPEENLKRFRNHYLGSVKQVVSKDVIEVLARDNKCYKIPASNLFIEAKPSTIKEYERRRSTNQGEGVVWRRIQELNHVLTSAGRRNTAVLQDRLNSIRRFLSPQGNDMLMMELPVYGGGQANLDLRPTVVQSEVG
jgi:hypothetical protein